MQSKCTGQQYLAEFLGTLILVLVGVGTSLMTGPQVGILGISFGFGLTLLALIYVLGPISGCHINPAITLGLFLIRRFEGKHVIPYVLAQFLGAMAGAYLVYMIASGKAGFVIGNFACTGMGAHSPQEYSVMACIFTEVVITTLLVMVVMVATRADFPFGFAPLAVSGTLIAIHLMSIPVTNTSANLARSFATAMVAKGWALDQLGFFAGAQLLAVLLAAILYRLVYGCR